MDKLKAFQVDNEDYDGLRSVVAFAKSAVEARRRGASQLDIEFESVGSCRRKPEFDTYAERGFVPVEVLIGYGWRYECTGCYQMVSEDGETEEGDPLEPVYTDHDVWCSPRCKAVYDRECYMRKRIADMAKAAMFRMFAKRYPEATIKGYHVHSRGSKIIQALVYFNFPGSKYGGTFRFRCESSKATRDNPDLTVAHGDLDAWHSYRDNSQAGLKSPQGDEVAAASQVVGLTHKNGGAA